ncbi:DUF3857 domain-containing protein [Aegicerativicinus sediminis]|uniref:DUF3857 domain-containing protein n=1 Tax=Aegicerativicinus sediminis TaxID=2893202 RepID=UPI001E2E78AD|nr:DUF3857 domain-containing protein [Aegicerativicinus sediminis]
MKNFILLTIIIPFISFSQDFKDEDYIYLKRHEHIAVDLAGNKFNISKDISEQAEFLTARKLFFANETMSYDSFTKIEDIDAYTLIPATGKKIPVDYIETKREFDNGIFYSDQESKTFTFPAVTKGAITNLSYKEIVSDPHFMGMFRFGTYVPTKEAQLSIEFPKNVNIGYIDFNTEKINLQFDKKDLGEKYLYTWSVENVDGFQGEDKSESALYYLPHIIVYIKSYELDGTTHTVLNDVSDLYKWYTTLVEQIDHSSSEKVYAIADNITSKLKTKREKAQAIFDWVQGNITYVAFEDGLGGFVPRSAASVCDKRYGDCKDMANLLFEMLNHAGIEAYRTWIGTRDRQYSYHQVPTPIVDNHMITTAIIDKDTIFLDATDSYIPFGMPSSFTQTKEALIGIDKDNYKIITVPAQPAQKSVTRVNCLMNLDGETLKVTETRDLSGYDKVEFVSKYTFAKGDTSLEEFLNTTLALGNNKTNYTNITQDNFDNKEAPLKISYDLNINNYAKTIGDKIYLNLNIDKTLSNSNVDLQTRKYSKKIDHKFKKIFNTEFQLPAGYKVSDLPEPSTYDHEDYSFNISYKQEDGKVIQEKTLIINTLSIENDNFGSWNEFIKSLIKAYKKSIIIEKI